MVLNAEFYTKVKNIYTFSKDSNLRLIKLPRIIEIVTESFQRIHYL